MEKCVIQCEGSEMCNLEMPWISANEFTTTSTVFTTETAPVTSTPLGLPSNAAVTSTAAKKFTTSTVQASDNCTGDDTSTLVDPIFFFAVTPNCNLLVFARSFKGIDLPRITNLNSSSHDCILQPPIVFQWSQNELALLHSNRNDSLLTRYSMESVDLKGKVDVKKLSTESFRPSVVPTTCHKRSTVTVNEKDVFICYSFLSHNSSSIDMTTYGYDRQYSLYRNISSLTISLPHYVKIHANKLLAYEEGNSTKIWMQSRLNWLYNLDTVDFQTQRRTRLTTYLMEEPSSRTHLLFSDKVGITTAACNFHNRNCTYHFHRINKKSALTSVCLVKYDYLIRIGVIALPKTIESLTDTSTELAPLVLDPQAQHQTSSNSEKKIDTEEYEPLDADYGAYNVVIALCIIVFVYLLLYFGLLLYPEQRAEIEYMQATYAGLEELVDELGLNWTQFKTELAPDVNEEAIERLSRQKQFVPTHKANKPPQNSSQVTKHKKCTNIVAKKSCEVPPPQVNQLKQSGELQIKNGNSQQHSCSLDSPTGSIDKSLNRPKNEEGVGLRSCETQPTPPDEDSNEYKFSLQPPVSLKKKAKRNKKQQSSLPVVPEEIDPKNGKVLKEATQMHGMQKDKQDSSAIPKPKGQANGSPHKEVKLVTPPIDERSPPVNGSSQKSAEMPGFNPEAENVAGSSKMRRTKKVAPLIDEPSPLVNGSTQHSAEMPGPNQETVPALPYGMVAVPEEAHSDYAQEHVRKVFPQEVNLATSKQRKKDDRLDAGRSAEKQHKIKKQRYELKLTGDTEHRKKEKKPRHPVRTDL